MIIIELIEALRKQIDFCERERNYKCGVYITTEENKYIVMKVIDNILPSIGREVEIRNSQCESFVRYPNGNIIRIVRANSGARGHRFNGVIIDSNVPQECINTIILPCLMPLKLEDGTYSRYDNPRLREYHCYISKKDVIESEKHKHLIYVISSGYLNESQRDILDAITYWMQFKNNNYIKFEKEYKSMWIATEYNQPIRTIEKDNNKILVFNALGIPKKNIEYKTEFVNKSKETYLIIRGRVELTDINYENGINVRMKIDTDVYDGYDVIIENGLVFVRLHEIVNEAPVLKDYGVA